MWISCDFMCNFLFWRRKAYSSFTPPVKPTVALLLRWVKLLYSKDLSIRSFAREEKKQDIFAFKLS